MASAMIQRRFMRRSSEEGTASWIGILRNVIIVKKSCECPNNWPLTSYYMRDQQVPLAKAFFGGHFFKSHLLTKTMSRSPTNWISFMVYEKSFEPSENLSSLDYSCGSSNSLSSLWGRPTTASTASYFTQLFGTNSHFPKAKADKKGPG